MKLPATKSRNYHSLCVISKNYNSRFQFLYTPCSCSIHLLQKQLRVYWHLICMFKVKVHRKWFDNEQDCTIRIRTHMMTNKTWRKIGRNSAHANDFIHATWNRSNAWKLRLKYLILSYMDSHFNSYPYVGVICVFVCICVYMY